MTTLYDLAIEVQSIKQTLNNIEVKGQQNASLLVSACLRCDKIVEAINSVAKSISEKPKESTESEGDVNAE